MKKTLKKWIFKVSMVNILYMIPLLKAFAGTEKHIYSILTNLDRKTFAPHLCYFKGPSTNNLPAKAFLEYGIPIMKFPMNTIYGYDALKNAFSLRRYIKEKDIKIIQTFHPNADLYGPLIGLLSNVSIIISSRRDLGLNRRHLVLQKIINSIVDVIITPSKAVKQYVIDKEKIPDAKIKIIYNGINDNYLIPCEDTYSCRRKLGLEGCNFVVTIISNLKKIKGLDYFIRACSIMDEYIPQAKYIIVGDGVERNSLNKLTTEIGLDQKIIFAGFQRDIKQYLEASDVYVSSSLSEGFSNSILEAMAMGLPAVVTNVGGNNEAIIHGEGGFLVPSKKPDDMAAKVVKLYNDKQMRARMGKYNRKLIEERFTLKKMVIEHEIVYETLLRKKL